MPVSSIPFQYPGPQHNDMSSVVDGFESLARAKEQTCSFRKIILETRNQKEGSSIAISDPRERLVRAIVAILTGSREQTSSAQVSISRRGTRGRLIGSFRGVFRTQGKTCVPLLLSIREDLFSSKRVGGKKARWEERVCMRANVVRLT
jgi:hypothetical protein